MKKVEMKMEDPKVKGKRRILTDSESNLKLECRIDPNTFEGKWLNHRPITRKQEEILNLYMDAKSKDRLQAFTCMTISPSVEKGEVVYQKGLQVKTGFSRSQWAKMLKNYDPQRNSRQMTRTAYVCRNLLLIQRLVESGYNIDEAWIAVCDDSRKIGHYFDSEKHQNFFELTGSREICGFYDLGNVWKYLAEDPWDEDDGFFVGGGSYWEKGICTPVGYMDYYWNLGDTKICGVAEIMMD